MTGIPVKQLKDKDGTNIQPNSPDKVGYAQYGSGVSMSWGSDQPITQDGWIRFQGSVNNTGGTPIIVYINDDQMGYIDEGTGEAILPVKNGDTVKAIGGDLYQDLFFYPNRTALGGGGSLTP